MNRKYKFLSHLHTASTRKKYRAAKTTPNCPALDKGDEAFTPVLPQSLHMGFPEMDGIGKAALYSKGSLEEGEGADIYRMSADSTP